MNGNDQNSEYEENRRVEFQEITPEEETRVVSEIMARFPRTLPHQGATLCLPYPDSDNLSKLQEAERRRRFFAEVQRIVQCPGDCQVYVVWDDPSEPSLQMRFADLSAGFSEFVRHTTIYVVPADVSWCAAVSKQDDFGFAHSSG